jgi:hypothetical protein
MVAIASCGIALTMVRWCSVNSPQHALLFSLGPLCGIYLHRLRGGNGIGGGTIGGIASGFVFDTGAYFERTFCGGPSVRMNYAGLLAVVTLLDGLAGLFLGVVCCLGDRASVTVSARKAL